MEILMISCVATFFVGIFLLIFKKRSRKIGGLVAIFSFLIFAVGTSLDADQTAKEMGFDDYNDMKAGESAGYTDATLWAKDRDQVLAEAAAQAELAAELAAKEAEQKEAQEEAQRALEVAQKAKNDKDFREFGHHCLSAWDGSLPALVDAVTVQLRNPKSFEHAETKTVRVDQQGFNGIVMEFRAENGFGGMNVMQAVGTFKNETCALGEYEVLS